MKRLGHGLLGVGVLFVAASAHGEGTAELGVWQRLQASTVVHATVVDSENESICWTGNDDLRIYEPGPGPEIPASPLSSGGCASLPANTDGEYLIDVLSDQTSAGWDITVCDTSGDGSCDPGDEIPGRVYSTEWQFNAGDYTAARATYGSFYALLPGGDPDIDVRNTVVELRIDGLAGYVFEMGVNQFGLDAPFGSLSVRDDQNPTFAPQYRLYLNPPDQALYNPLVPAVSNFVFDNPSSTHNCVIPGSAPPAEFRFDSNIEGTYHLVCDLNQDGQYDITDPTDLVIHGSASPGTETVPWDGNDTGGNPVTTGTYDCRLQLNIGEFHYVGHDMESSYQGLRMFEVDGVGNRSPLDMHWNDDDVQAGAVPMPDGHASPARPPVGGLGSGDPALCARAFSAAVTPGDPGGCPTPDDSGSNARAWGRFQSTSKGNNAWLDTYTVTDMDLSTTLQVVVAEVGDDSDNDSVPSTVEACDLGTDPNNDDSDNDGIDDFVESNGGQPIDTDGDGTLDALDLDSDNDGVGDAIDSAWRDPDVCEDTDADGCDDCAVGFDDFGPQPDNYPANDGLDTDGDGLCDSGGNDPDLDNDGVLNGADTAPLDPNICEDSDGDGCDDCAVGVDGFGPLADNTPANDGLDTDGDGLCDAGDPDLDNDGVLNLADTAPLDPSICEDSDSDSCDDCAVGTDGFGPLADNDPTNDGLDTDSDGLCDASDGDLDNDGVLNGADSAPLDPDLCEDSDNDSCDDCAVGTDGFGPLADNDPANDGPDNDGDGICDAGDNDTDGDGVDDPNDTDPLDPLVCEDADGDGCDDCSQTGGPPDPANDGLDSDGDGLCDAGETAAGTDPDDADSDDDGVPDGQEPSWDEDSDGDGLINALDPDSDDDGLFDGTELGLDCDGADTDPAAMACTPDGDDGATTTDPLDPDTDGGGVSDGSEDSNLDGVVDAGETDPGAGHGADDANVVDSDDDGLSDDLEATLGTDPNDADTDDDGLLDGDEPNPNHDTDGDGLENPFDVDSDNDGLYDGTEVGNDCEHPDTDTALGHCVADGDGGSTITAPLNADTDGGGVMDGSEDPDLDGVPDGGETDPTAGHGADDNTVVDSDGDGLSDDLEVFLGSDPDDADSDDDGVLDGDEPNPSDDHDGDGEPNITDEDSDGDGLFDGTELGNGCSHPATDEAAGHCIPDGDAGATTTHMLDADTDDGGIPDGVEDADHDGVVDDGELDPNDPADDQVCTTDSDCGGAQSGVVCHDDQHYCVPGCRGLNGNGCPDGQVCTSMDETIGECVPEGTGGGGAGGMGGSGGVGGSPPPTDALESTYAQGGCTCTAPAGDGSGRPASWLLSLLGLGWLLRRRSRLAA